MADHRMLVVLWLLTSLPICLPLASQTEPKAEFREKVEVTEVLLDVLVTDGRGNVVVGLEAEDFVVEEEGERVEVTAATFYSNRALLATGEQASELGVDAERAPANRYFIIFLHDQRGGLPALVRQQLDAARYLERWVREELLPNDYVAVVKYDHKLKLYQDFTTEKEAILGAIDQTVAGKNPGAIWPSRLPRHEGPSLARNLPQGKELRRQTPKIYSGLQAVAEAVHQIRGRKNLLLFSVGFGLVNEFGTYEEDPRYYPDMMHALNDSNVAVYAIDLLPTSTGGAMGRTLSDSLSKLAFDTGGQYYFSFHTFLAPLHHVSQDNNGYYLLSYLSRHPAGASGYRQVEVRTRDPKLRVRARKGYRYGS